MHESIGTILLYSNKLWGSKVYQCCFYYNVWRCLYAMLYLNNVMTPCYQHKINVLIFDHAAIFILLLALGRTLLNVNARLIKCINSKLKVQSGPIMYWPIISPIIRCTKTHYTMNNVLSGLLLAWPLTI